MDEVRAVCSAALGLREDAGLRVRLPLPGSDRRRARRRPSSRAFADLIADELNVKAVELDADSSALGTRVLRPNAKVLGPEARQGRADGHQGRQGRRLDDERRRHASTVAGHTLGDGEFELALQPAEGRTAAAVRMSIRRVEPSTSDWSSTSTPRSRPSSRPKGWPATSSASCSRPARTATST